MENEANWDDTKNPQMVVVHIKDFEVVGEEERTPGWYWGMSWTDQITEDLIDLPQYDSELQILNGPYTNAQESEENAQKWWVKSGLRLYAHKDG